MTNTTPDPERSIAEMDDEQLPVPSTDCMDPLTSLASMVRNMLLRPNSSSVPHSWRWAPRSRTS